MKNLSFIILGTIAVVLIGLAVWQFMWMSSVVDNYDSTRSYKVSDREFSIKEDDLHDSNFDRLIADPSFEEEVDLPVDSSMIKSEMEIEKVEEEELKAIAVSDKPSVLESNEVKSLPAIEPDSVKNDRARKKPVLEPYEKVITEKDTISIKLKSDKPLPPRRKVIASTPSFSNKPLNIPSRALTTHATSTYPYY